MSYKYIIGIDGGGTKTKGVLFDQEGFLLKTHILGPSNMSVDQEIAMKTIDQMLEVLTEKIALSELGYIALGVAGASKISNHEAYLKPLKLKYQTPMILTTDAHIALYAIDRKDDEIAMLILSGTGSTIMIGNDLKTLMIGGYGHLIGDEGSAYHVVIQAIKDMIAHDESDIICTPFEEKLKKHLKIKDLQDIKKFVYGHSKNEIADVAQVISSYAQDGDKDAKRLLEQEGLLLSKQAIKAYEKLKTNQPVVIAFKGGFVEKAPYVKETCLNELNKHLKHYRITTEEKDPIYGAFQLAKSQLRGLDL